MATMSRNPPQTTSNGVITAPPKGMIGGNRKKQKRRAKQAAKAASQAVQPRPDDAHTDDIDYDEDPLVYAEEDEYEYSEAENQQYDAYPPDDAQGRGSYDMPPPSTVPGKKNKKKKKKAGGAPTDAHALYSSDMLTTSRLPDLPSAPTAVDRKGSNNVQHQQNIWNTTTQQERQNIKNFWLSLSEDERKSLLKIEKETVLRKMKQQQQKHSCQCTVCGRKRTAIEEELEVLYEGYYEELEQYAHHDHPHPTSRNLLPAPLAHSHAQHPLATPHPNLHSHHRSSQMLEHLDDDEDEEDEDDYEEEEEGEDSGDEYSEEEDEDDFSDEEVELARPPVPDFFNFGQNLTVKDNLLTVADDLLKNDGRKFIEMMEQLAERRMQRETEAEFAAANPAHSNNYHNNDGYGNDESMGPDDEFDDEEGSYDSQEYDEDELDDEDEMSGLTEEQRMQEGRRMFQIFAARMFEHRVLTAYKEKVAAERQRKLLEELQDEEKLEAQREAKKKRDAEKKKDKKRQQQAAKAEERAKKEAEKAAEEARLKEAEEKKHEEQRRKKEEQRKKKEEEKRKLEEERLRKEAEKTRRQQEEQQRREDAERKAREQKALEKSRKEEARKREKEEREAKEKALRDRKSEEERAKASKEVKATTKEADTPSELKAQQPPQIVKRPSQPSMVAVPGVFAKQQPQAQQSTPASVSSPKSSVAMPAVPKASTAAKPKLPSQQGSHASSPKQAQSQVSSGPSKSSSPGSLPPQAIPQSISIPPKPVIQKPVSQHAPQGHQQHGLPPHLQQIQPPPGMLHPYQQQQHPHHNFAMPPAGYPNFQTPSPGGLSAGIRPSPMFNQGPPPVSIPGRVASFGAPSMNGMPGPHSAGMVGMHGRGGFPFDSPGGASPNAPPGFGPQTAQISPTSLPLSANLSAGSDHSRAPINAHSRQQSMSEKPFDPAVAQPITRPAPIKRPTSIKAQDNSDVDDLSKHLGSSALLGDDEDDVLNNRQRGPFDNLGSFRGNSGGFGAPGGWNATSPFGQSNSLGQQWGGLPQSSISDWNSNGGFASASSGFGSIGSASGMHRGSALASNRPLTIRIAVCQACKQLSSMSPGSGNDFHDVNALVRQIELNRPPLEALPTLKEIEDICETEGDLQNGGGELQIRKSGISMLAVRWQPDATTPDLGRSAAIGSLGEIGSPMPGKSTPAFGFGAPGMGRSNTGSIGHWPNSGF